MKNVMPRLFIDNNLFKVLRRVRPTLLQRFRYPGLPCRGRGSFYGLNRASRDLVKINHGSVDYN